jgi:hypothetical protein
VLGCDTTAPFAWEVFDFTAVNNQVASTFRLNSQILPMRRILEFKGTNFFALTSAGGYYRVWDRTITTAGEVFLYNAGLFDNRGLAVKQTQT